MEQLLLKMNHKVDQANNEREEFKIEADMSKIDRIKLDEKMIYMKQQFEDFKEQTKGIQDACDKKVNDK